MDNCVWRRKAKIVAIVDMVLTFPSTLWLVLVLWYDDDRDELFQAYYDGASYRSKPQWMIGLLIVIVVLFYVMVAVEFFAAIRLIKATNPKEDPKESRRMAAFWRNVTIVLFSLFVVGQLSKLNIVGMIITIVWRSWSLYVVYKFLDELESYRITSVPSIDISTPECDENMSTPNYLSIRSFFVELSSL